MSSTLPQIKKILFTTDLSPETRNAFNYAVGIANRYGARLTLLFVMEATPRSEARISGIFSAKNAGPKCASPMSRRSARR